MGKTNPKLVKRLRRKKSIRKRISGTAERPRLTVFRSARHIYAQLVDDERGRTLAAASTLDAAFKQTGAYGGNKQAAAFVGKMLAERALERGIKRVVFDRNGYLFHGRVKSLADAAREAGLDF